MWTKNVVWVTVWVIFFTCSSGHPACKRNCWYLMPTVSRPAGVDFDGSRFWLKSFRTNFHRTTLDWHWRQTWCNPKNSSQTAQSVKILKLVVFSGSVFVVNYSRHWFIKSSPEEKTWQQSWKILTFCQLCFERCTTSRATRLVFEKYRPKRGQYILVKKYA
jgi:hypothetical protein